MDKKDYHANNEEEYLIRESEPEEYFEASSAKPALNFFERIKRQHIILGFIFVVGVFGAYKLLNYFFHTMLTKAQTLEKIQMQKKIENPLDKKQINVEMTKLLNPIAQGQLSLQSGLKSLGLQIGDIQTALLNLSTQLAQANDEIQALHVAQEKIMQKQSKTPTAGNGKSPKPIYYVRAIIPGRVWLTTPEGSTLTLGLGDQLAGYGHIDSINPDQGIVTLSSGAIIGYNPDDR
jgi:hypothetical protein